MEVTASVAEVLRASRIACGLVTLFVRHTSASLVIQENADADVRGSYSVTVAGGDFVVRGSCDVDGDGHRAVYEATAGKPASLTTDASIY